MAILGSTTLTGCTSIPNFIASGTLSFFRQTTAPINWVKQTTHNNKTLRVVSGTAGSGGTQVFTSVFTTITPSGSAGAVTLSVTQLGTHNHPVSNGTLHWRAGGIIGHPGVGPIRYTASTQQTAANAGSSGSHPHGLSFTSVDFNILYVDVIIASKS
jgi:hypothetical protein